MISGVNAPLCVQLHCQVVVCIVIHDSINLETRNLSFLLLTTKQHTEVAVSSNESLQQYSDEEFSNNSSFLTKCLGF